MYIPCLITFSQESRSTQVDTERLLAQILCMSAYLS